MERFRVTPSSSLWTLAWPLHAYKGHCPFGRPARRHSRMRLQLMASARHAIDSRDASLLPIYALWACTFIQSHDPEAIASLLSMVPRRVAVLLVLLWAFLRLRRTHRPLRISKERRFLRRYCGSAPFHRARLGH